MPKYLAIASYTAEGVKGVLKDGGTARVAAIRKMAEGLGGTVEAFYFAFGADDAYVIFDVPDNATTAAISLTVGASGAARVKTVVLLTPEEVDEATGKSVDYRPPGA